MTTNTINMLVFSLLQMERVPGDNNYLPVRNSPSRDFDRFIGKWSRVAHGLSGGS